MTTTAIEGINWPSLTFGPINLWNCPHWDPAAIRVAKAAGIRAARSFEHIKARQERFEAAHRQATQWR